MLIATKITFLSFLVIIAIASSNSLSAAEDSKLIYIAFMTTSSGSFVSSGAIPAVELAIERVNNDSSILLGYHLTYSKIFNLTVRTSNACTLHVYSVNFPTSSSVTELILWRLSLKW